MISRIFLMMLSVLVCSTNLPAQNSKPGKITVKSYPKTKTIECSGEHVVVMDDYYKLTITGNCSILEVYGKKNIITMGTVGLMILHGDDNRITYRVNPERKTKIRRHGEDNRVTKIE